MIPCTCGAQADDHSVSHAPDCPQYRLRAAAPSLYEALRDLATAAEAEITMTNVIRLAPAIDRAQAALALVDRG